MAYAYDASKSEEQKKEMQQKVIDLAESFKENPQEFVEYLRFSSQFYNYSARNSMLIFSQNEGARYCNSFKAFQDMGYSVKRGEHGMKILVPTVKTYLHIGDDLVPLSKATAEQKAAYKLHQIQSEQKLYFKVGTVFDIAQTNCPKEDYPKYLDLGYSSEQHAQICDTMKKFCEEKLHCPVHESNFNSVVLRGYYSPSANSISLSGMFDDTTKLSILTHEAGHAILHNDKEMMQQKRPEAQVEFEADATSVMLQSYFGVEIAESRLRHLSDCYNEMLSDKNITSKDVTASLDRAHKAFKIVVENVNQELRPELAQTQAQTSEQKTPENIKVADNSNNFVNIRNKISKVTFDTNDKNYLRFNVTTESGNGLEGIYRIEADGNGQGNKLVSIESADSHPDIIKNWGYIEKQLLNYTYPTPAIVQESLTQGRVDYLLSAGNVKFEHCLFENIEFNQSAAKIIQASDCMFNNCKFEGCDFIGTDFSCTSFKGCTIRNSNFSGAEAPACIYEYTQIYDSSFSNASMSDNTFRQSSFNRCDLSGVNINNSEINTSYFRNATIKEPVKNIDKISVTMSGATSAEVANYKQQLLKNLNPQNNNPNTQNSNYTITQNNAQSAQAQTSASQQPIMPSQLPDMGMGGMSFGM